MSENQITKCVDHLGFTNQHCPDCRLEVDAFGNTEDQFEYCCFPDCGCDGARVCMTGEPNSASQAMNLERTKRQQK